MDSIERVDLQYAVLGLGRFGMSIVRTLAEYDVTVLACDTNEERLNEAAEYTSHVVQADVADEDTLKDLGIGDFDVVVLAMGENFEASIMATMAAKELGVPKIVVKALGQRQKKILQRIGADQVILPEIEMGEKVAHSLIDPDMIDILEKAGRQAITEIHPHRDWIGHTVAALDIRKNYDYTIMAVIRDQKIIIPVPADLTMEQDDVLIMLSNE
ncbi:potassium channel family protein [Lapidilactobacillus gannanensis]|jgi:trk system potassium uptake protein TrkA|uniref:Potassium channel family protein n=1 Tax=Lapidilactobacillus gannanensis TaxID=2486002 RepID=A0ABW4BK66_9LACO|nr:TrkA family potassium uptake protein [Lapidilactobacillus gannanensis]MCH4057025.1 TrkA family potassium uptake protein [Lactobacillaceae bacterium]